MSIESWLRSATWPLRQFVVRCLVWFKQGVIESIFGLLAVAAVSIFLYSVVQNASIATAVSAWGPFDNVFGIVSVAVELVVFGGCARTAVYVKKQERIGWVGLTILSTVLLYLTYLVIRVVPGGIDMPPIV